MSTKKAWAMYRASQRLRDLHEDMTIIQVQTLLLVAWKPRILQSELYRLLNISDSATSRNIALLSDIGSRTRDGLGLISLDPNPDDRREKFLELTSKGERLLADLIGDIYGSTQARSSELSS